jgi:exo-beta-1,3-glucanase (GH17 family)
MSHRPDHISKFKVLKHHQGSQFLENKTDDDIRNIFLEILYGGIHGFCFSLYEDGQKPGDIISEGQIRRRMGILKPYTQWIRSFSCIDGNELIPVVAREHGLKTLVGAWLGTDDEKNRQEIANLITLAKNGFVDVAAVGNEVLYRKDLSKEELIGFIREVKKEIPGVPVGYVDAYYEFRDNQDIADTCDVILCNCYPFWEGTPFEHSLQHMEHMYHQASLAAKGKRVIITETGWPSQGENTGNAFPSHGNALKYFVNSQLWAMDVNAEIFYFSSFDESWKVGAEGEVGAFWGIWDKNENLKF